VRGTTRLLESSPTRPARRMRFWLVSGNGPSRPEEPLTVGFKDGSRALAVFSFEEEARLFLRLGGRRGWRVRAAGVGELVSILSGPGVGVELVALDPLSQGEAAEVNRLLCVKRERFVGFLLRKGSRRA
jgi:hypothetical protein